MKLLLVPRLQNYYLFINTFDYLDYNFISKSNEIIKFENCKFKINIFLPHKNNINNLIDLYAQNLNLEWSCTQQSYLKLKYIMYNNWIEFFQNTIRGCKLYEFLEYCRNSIFIDKSIRKEKNNDYKIQILNKTQWNEFKCNSFILNYFFYNSKLNLINLIFINFTNNKFNFYKQFTKLNLLP